MTWLAVALGGAAGSVARYAVGVGMQRVSADFPYGTRTIYAARAGPAARC